MPHVVCREPLCPNEAVWSGRCRDHASANDKRARRGTPGLLVYHSAKWQRTRRRYLRRHPLCEAEGCRRIATQVHHRIDLDDGGDP
jgi:hypothetical protein